MIMLKQKAESTHRRIPRDFLHVPQTTGKGWPRKQAHKLSSEQEKGSAFLQWKLRTMQPRKETRKDCKVFLDNMVSICAPMAKNANTLPSIIKTANGKTAYCLNLVQIQVTFASSRVHTPLPSTQKAGG